MPIHECRLPKGGRGYKWGDHGTCYPTRAQAERQAEAAHANGFVGDSQHKITSPTGKDHPLKPIHANAGIEAAYRKRLLRLIDAMEKSVLRWLTVAYRKQQSKIAQDAGPGAVLSDTTRSLRRRWENNFNDAAVELAKWFAQKSKDYSDPTLMNILRDAGIAIDFRMTKSLQTVMTAMIEENVSLIRSIPERAFTEIEGMVMRSVQEGRDLETLTKQLQKQFSVTKRRAKLIARDQNNKATANITRTRQKSLGITKAVWRHSAGGKDPRPSHVAADGKQYDIDKGMYLDGKWVWPGTEINCRCVSIPVIPGIDS